eukprot:154314-Hanusia_phi.AAC.1
MYVVLARHPRLVRFLGQSEDCGARLLLTEFAELGSLQHAFARLEDQVSLDHRIVMMAQVAQGMEHLIDNQMLHRDLSARHVLLFSFDKDNVQKTSVKISAHAMAAEALQKLRLELSGEELPVRHMPPE